MKPGFKPGLKSQVVDPETDVMFNCSATGYPKPFVHWENSKRRKVEEGGYFIIKNVRKSATYTCIATNTLGNATVSVNVTLSGLPFAPQNVVEKSKTGHTLTISWQDGETGTEIDHHKINYRKKGDLYWKTAVYNMQGNLREYTLDDLNAYTDYEVQVFAQNKFGTSKGSKVIMMTTGETGKFINTKCFTQCISQDFSQSTCKLSTGSLHQSGTWQSLL
jgi:netrin-G3 ligand